MLLPQELAKGSGYWRVAHPRGWVKRQPLRSLPFIAGFVPPYPNVKA